MAGFGKENLEDTPSTSSSMNSNLLPGQSLIQGLLKEVREFGGQDGKPKIFEHIFVQAAKDEYEHPKSFPVRSEKILGPVGQIFSVVAEIRSWRQRDFFNVNLWAI